MKNRKTSILISTLLICSGFMAYNSSCAVSAETTAMPSVTEATTVTTTPEMTTTTPPIDTEMTTTAETTTVTTSKVDTTTVDIDVNIIKLPNNVVRIQMKAPQDMEYALQMVVNYNGEALDLLNTSSALVSNDDVKVDENGTNKSIKFAGTNTTVKEDYEYFFEADFEILDSEIDDGIDVDVTEFKEVIGVEDSMLKDVNLNVNRSEAREYILGDTNLNGKIDIMDAVRILQKKEGLLTSFRTVYVDGDFNYDGVVDEKDNLFIADIDRNGIINTTDAIYVLKYLTEDNIVFLRSENVHSTILDTDGNPVEGATVQYIRTKTGTKYGTAESGEDGTFDIKALEGDATIFITKDGYNPVTMSINIDGYDNTAPIRGNIVMSKKSDNVNVSGTVVNQDGVPVSVEIALFYEDETNEEVFETTSNEDGSFSFEDGVALGTYLLGLDRNLVEGESVDITGPIDDLQLVYNVRTEVGGNVVDEDGNALENVGVYLYDKDGSYIVGAEKTDLPSDDLLDCTNEYGGFLNFISVPAGTYKLELKSLDDDTYATYSTEITVDNIDIHNIELGTITLEKTVPDEYTISGAIVDSDGNPISGATISNGDETATSSEDGTFSFSVGSGEYSLTFICEGYKTTTQNVTVDTENITLENITLLKDDTLSHHVTGTVLDANQNPLVGFNVTLSDGNYTATTDENGNFDIELDTGNYTLNIYSADGNTTHYIAYSKDITISDDTDTLSLGDIVLYEAVPIALKTVDEDGNPVSVSFSVFTAEDFKNGGYRIDKGSTDENGLPVSDYDGYYQSAYITTGDYVLLLNDTAYFGTTNDYAFVAVDFTIDDITQPIDLGTITIPKANVITDKSVATFLNSAYDYNTNYCTIYDGTKDYKSYTMDGVTYYDGVTFANDTGTLKTVSSSFNVDNIDSITFDVSHVDGSPLKDVTLNVYLDGELYRPYDIKATSNATTITIDTSEASKIMFEFEDLYWGNTSYAIGNISIDGNTAELSPSVPVYDDITAFLNSAYDYDSNYCTIYDNSIATKSFNMNNVSYTNGLTFANNSGTLKTVSSSFNVENVDNITFKVGHVDNTPNNDTTLNIYLDDVLTQTNEISSTGIPQSITVDTSNAKTIRFEFVEVGFNNTSFALADISINDSGTDDNNDDNIDIIEETINNIPVNDYNQLVNDMISAVNEYRQQNGLTPYKTADSITELAKQRASEQETTGMSHTRPNETKFSTIFSEHNIQYTSCGENAAISYASIDDMVDDVLGRWKASSGHNANILGDYEYIGVSVDYYNGTYYWIQLFYSGNIE